MSSRSLRGDDSAQSDETVVDEEQATLAEMIAAATTAKAKTTKPPDFIMGKYIESQSDCGIGLS